MRKIALFGTVMALVLTLAVVVPVFGAPPTTVPPSHQDRGHQPSSPLATGTILTIGGSGKAFNITEHHKSTSVGVDATISLTAKVVKSNPGRGMLNFTGGTLTITNVGTFTVVSGHGIITYHHSHMILHLVVKNSAGKTFHLILFGDHVTPKVSSTAAFTVDFRMPQSKLAHLWFLEFKGAKVTP